jgi:hypothetical protein
MHLTAGRAGMICAGVIATLVLSVPASGTAERQSRRPSATSTATAQTTALSPQDRQPVTATIYSRNIALHFDDTDAMGWA